MDKTRLWIIGSVLVMVAVVALGWLLGIQPQLDQATAASAQTASVESGNTVKAAVLAKMKKDSENLGALKKQLTELGTSVPSKAEWSSFGDELNGMATANAVTIVASTAGDGQAYALPESPAAAAPAAGSTGGSTATPSPTPTPTATAAPVKVPGSPPLTSPLITSADFTLIPVSVTVRGSEDQVLGFVRSAQNGSRLFLVNGLTIDPSASAPGFDAQLSGYIYVLSDGSEAKTTK